MRLKYVADVESGIHLSAWKVNPLKLALGRQGVQDRRRGREAVLAPSCLCSGTASSEGWEAGTAWPLAGAVVLTRSVCDDMCAVKHHAYDSICLFLTHRAPCTALCLLPSPSAGSKVAFPPREPWVCPGGPWRLPVGYRPHFWSHFCQEPRLLCDPTDSRLPVGWDRICCSEVTCVWNPLQIAPAVPLV